MKTSPPVAAGTASTSPATTIAPQPATTGPDRSSGPGRRAGSGDGQRAAGLRPLLIDVAVPLGGYYLLHDAFGMGLVLSLGLSGIVPAVRGVLSVVRDREVNRLAVLMVVVNVVGIALSFVTGNPRIMLAKDSGISSVIGLCVLYSAFTSRPMMSAGLRPWLVKGDAAKDGAWERLSSGSRRFQRLERRFSLVWGVALLTECVLRLVGAFTLPISTMVWLGTVITVVAICLAIAVSGRATVPMEKMIIEEAAAGTAA